MRVLKGCIIKVDDHRYLYSWALCNTGGVATMCSDGQLFTSVATRVFLRGHLKVFRSVDTLRGGRGGGGAKQLSCDRSRNRLKMLYCLCCVRLNDGSIKTAWQRSTKKQRLGFEFENISLFLSFNTKMLFEMSKWIKNSRVPVASLLCCSGANWMIGLLQMGGRDHSAD